MSAIVLSFLLYKAAMLGPAPSRYELVARRNGFTYPQECFVYPGDWFANSTEMECRSSDGNKWMHASFEEEQD